MRGNRRLAGIGEFEEYELRAADERTYDADDRVQAGIVQWRASCLLDMGFQLSDAFDLARRKDVDRERVAHLLHAGATHAQVVSLVT